MVSSSIATLAVAGVVAAAVQPAQVAAAALDTFGFYTPSQDIEQHRRIDLDVKEFADFTGAADWDAAEELYREGKNSAKSSSMRTLEGFSTKLNASAESIQTDAADGILLPEFYLFSDYYGSDHYAHNFVVNALTDTNGTDANGDALDTDSVRNQLAKKGAAYQVVGMYVLYELSKALGLCFQGLDGSKNWDEGAAFYVGSLIDANGAGSGQLGYTLAEKRCVSFGTCTGKGATEEGTGPLSAANEAAMAAFRTGLTAILAKECAAASEQRQIIRKQMQIALLQGTLLYAFKGDTSAAAAAEGADGTRKAMAEGWAFAAAVLPFLHQARPATAVVVQSNMELTANVAASVQDGYQAVFASTYLALPALCISCAELGAAGFATATGATPPACVDDEAALAAGCEEYLRPVVAADDDKEVDVGLIVGLSVGAVIVIGIIVGAMLYVKNSESESAVATKDGAERV